MSHQNLFLVVPPRQRSEQPRFRGMSDPGIALANLVLIATAVHGMLLLVSFAVFLAAPLDVQIFIVAAWASYAMLAVAFIKSALKRKP